MVCVRPTYLRKSSCQTKPKLRWFRLRVVADSLMEKSLSFSNGRGKLAGAIRSHPSPNVSHMRGLSFHLDDGLGR